MRVVARGEHELRLWRLHSISIEIGRSSIRKIYRWWLESSTRRTPISKWLTNWTFKNELYCRLRRLRPTPIKIGWSSIRKVFWQWLETSILRSENSEHTQWARQLPMIGNVGPTRVQGVPAVPAGWYLATSPLPPNKWPLSLSSRFHAFISTGGAL